MLHHRELLTGVSLFYLTKTFVSSAFIYAQNQGGFKTEYAKGATDAPLLFSAFKYNVGFWPPVKVAQVGNLVNYQSKFSSVFELCAGSSLPQQITISAGISRGWTTPPRLSEI